MTSLYPPGPAVVPRQITRPTLGYRLQVLLVLFSLLLSFAFYLALIAGSAWLCYFAVSAPWPARGGTGYIIVRLGGIVCSALLFLYLLKGLFKGSRQNQTLLVEITEADQPLLFDFIRRVCADTRAPFPHKVYVSPEVNAGVFYHSSLLSLVLPTPKNLLIGLGLVNMLNLSELKAVLAHEFGHFSQRSMKVGSYVYVANRVLADIIYGRDFLDDIVNQAKTWDIRIAIFAWIFLGVLWGLRKLLEGIFKGINLANLSLSRAMEFNADRVAVSVAGSDPMVHGLLRSGYADQAFRQLAGDLWSAADHQLYSADIFAHHHAAGARLRRVLKKPTLGEPPATRGPDVRVFEEDESDAGVPSMWATHPSNRDREKNAKETYVATDVDERSSWILFMNPQKLRREVSKRYYHVAHNAFPPPTLSDPEVVQRFLDDEYAETTYAERYAGLYDGRYLEIKDLAALARPVDRPAPEAAYRDLQDVYGPSLAPWVEEYTKRLNDFDMLVALATGRTVPKGPMIEFRGKSYRSQEAQGLLEQVGREIEADREVLAGFDERVFCAYATLAQMDPELNLELMSRYRFHLAAQDMHRNVSKAINETHNALAYAGGRGQLSPEEFAEVRQVLSGSAAKLHNILKEADGLRVPALRNMPAGTDLRGFLLQKPVVRHLGTMEQSIPPTWVSQLLAQAGEIQDKLKRLLFKSMGGILALQERIAEDWGKASPGGEHAGPAAGP